MDKLRHLHQLVAFRIGFTEAVIVRVVVMQVQQELIGEFFQATGEIVDV